MNRLADWLFWLADTAKSRRLDLSLLVITSRTANGPMMGNASG